MQAIKHKDLPRLGDLAAHVKGELAGNAQQEVAGICAFDEQVPGCLAFSTEKKLENLAAALHQTKLAGLLLRRELNQPELPRGNYIFVADPQRALIDLIPLFFAPESLPAEISARAEIHPGAVIGRRVHIGAFCSIAEGVVIGDDVCIHPHVTIYRGARIGAGSIVHANAVIREDIEIGSNVVIQPGAVIGSDGFGFLPDPAQGLRSIPQVGVAKLGDRVEVGANTCVDRAALGTTRIELGTKLDNLVQVGHNCRVGPYAIVCGQAGIAGSSTIGQGVVLGGQAGVKDHTTIASGVRVSAQGGVSWDLTEPGDYMGFPAIPAISFRRQTATLQSLDRTLKKMKASIRERNEKQDR